MPIKLNLVSVIVTSMLLNAGCAATNWSGAPREAGDFHFRGNTFLAGPAPVMVKRTAFRDSPFFDTPSVSEYTDPADVMRIGDARLDTISYVYFNDQLFRIVIGFQNDRLCSSAKGIVPTVESRYKLQMSIYTAPTQPNLFVAKAESGNLRVVSLCRQDGDERVSQLSFDYMPIYEAAKSVDDRAHRDKELGRIQKEKQGF
jgi:hypothetical protein